MDIREGLASLDKLGPRVLYHHPARPSSYIYHAISYAMNYCALSCVPDAFFFCFLFFLRRLNRTRNLRFLKIGEHYFYQVVVVEVGNVYFRVPTNFTVWTDFEIYDLEEEKEVVLRL